MAEAAKQQSQSSASEQSVTRRHESYPSRDLFSAGSYWNLSPFAMMRRLSEEMDRAFANAFNLSPGTEFSRGWYPAIEVREQNGTLEVAAELPGMTKDDVKVECTDEGIIIEGEKRREHEETREGTRRSERSYGRFYRVVPVPQGAEVDKAKADFKNGVLHVRVPVPENKQRRRQIPIAA